MSDGGKEKGHVAWDRELLLAPPPGLVAASGFAVKAGGGGGGGAGGQVREQITLASKS